MQRGLHGHARGAELSDRGHLVHRDARPGAEPAAGAPGGVVRPAGLAAAGVAELLRARAAGRIAAAPDGVELVAVSPDPLRHRLDGDLPQCSPGDAPGAKSWRRPSAGGPVSVGGCLRRHSHGARAGAGVSQRVWHGRLDRATGRHRSPGGPGAGVAAGDRVVAAALAARDRPPAAAALGWASQRAAAGDALCPADQGRTVAAGVSDGQRARTPHHRADGNTGGRDWPGDLG